MSGRLVYREAPGDRDYGADAERLSRIAAERGYDVDKYDAYRAWEQHSADWCASWLMLDGSTDDELWEEVRQWLHEP